MSLAIRRVVNEMDATRVTERAGRWYLRHVAIDDDVSVFLVSARAPAGTMACDLKPESLEFLGLAEGELALPITLLAELTAWPAL